MIFIIIKLIASIMSCSTHSMSEIEDIVGYKHTENKELQEEVRNNMDVYKEIIFQIMNWYVSNNIQDVNKNAREKFNIYFQKLIRGYKIFCRKSILIYVYRKMVENGEIERDYILLQLLQKKPSRNLSGVTVITVLTSPYPNGQNFSCKHNCYYCPNEPGQPRSYLKKEPAVARANRNEFEPILQMYDRMNCLYRNGHEIDKVEIIIEGGTYTEYPPDYLECFHRDLVYAANTYYDNYFHQMSKYGFFNPSQGYRDGYDLETEIKLNATAKTRIIGVCIETRPDVLLNKDGKQWIRRMREYGVTRVQLGVQHTDNDILKKINRGHGSKESQEGIRLLKDNGFKVDIHVMPDLPYSTPLKDKQMFDIIYKTPYYQPDQVKIYPCEITPYTVLSKWYRDKKYIPYSEKDKTKLRDVIKYGIESCPPWIRLPRVVRDIPLSYIEGGNRDSNLRQYLTNELSNDCCEIRTRECGRFEVDTSIHQPLCFVRKYITVGGIEYFISIESKNQKVLFGFLRLRIPISAQKQVFRSLLEKGLIRELHVYGDVVPVGIRREKKTQHQGYGKKMLKVAEHLSLYHKKRGVSIISGMGVVDYYKKQGYSQVSSYGYKNDILQSLYLNKEYNGDFMIKTFSKIDKIKYSWNRYFNYNYKIYTEKGLMYQRERILHCLFVLIHIIIIMYMI